MQIYGELRNELVRVRIVIGINDQKLSKVLQCDAELTLEKAITRVSTKEEVKINH